MRFRDGGRVEKEDEGESGEGRSGEKEVGKTFVV